MNQIIVRQGEVDYAASLNLAGEITRLVSEEKGVKIDTVRMIYGRLYYAAAVSWVASTVLGSDPPGKPLVFWESATLEGHICGA